MTSKPILALVVGALAGGVLAGVALADDVIAPPPPTTTVLAKSLFSEFRTDAHSTPADDWQAQLSTHGDSDLYVVDNKFAAGASTGWHSHPGPSLILVVSGTVTNYDSRDPACAGQDYSAGQGFIDPASVVHEVRNNTTAPAEVIAVQLLQHGATRKLPQPQPINCS